jgi:hypothetical protein
MPWSDGENKLVGEMRCTYTSICQPGNSVPSRQQRDIAVPRLGSNIAKSSQDPNPEGNEIAKKMKRGTYNNLPIREGRAIFISFR